ncbi:MAG: hypothetical protein AB3N20_07550 [Rhizobiaceae bacterium]
MDIGSLLAGGKNEHDVAASGSIVLILGSAPDAVRAAQWAKLPGLKIVCINNAWKIRNDWDYLVVPEDFPSDRYPPSCQIGQRIIEAADFVPSNNRFGGIVYAGATMAFTAGYWALATLRPKILAYLGCDMIYNGPRTHFYGQGTPDPLREDVTLGSLEAKSARIMAIAAANNCSCVNLSENTESRLLFPRVKYDDLKSGLPAPIVNDSIFDKAKMAEQALGYMVEDGKYWESCHSFDGNALAEIDRLWLQSVGRSDFEGLIGGNLSGGSSDRFGTPDQIRQDQSASGS